MRTLTFALAFAIITFTSCQKIPFTSEAEKSAIETELHYLTDNLSASWPLDSSQIANQILAYLDLEGYNFYGCAIVELDSIQLATSCAYWYRSSRKTVDHADLMHPSYDINSQSWLSLPLSQGQDLWSEPYFDDGGGEIWMQTYSVLILKDGKTVGLATTDIRVRQP